MNTLHQLHVMPERPNALELGTLIHETYSSVGKDVAMKMASFAELINASCETMPTLRGLNPRTVAAWASICRPAGTGVDANVVRRTIDGLYLGYLGESERQVATRLYESVFGGQGRPQ